uniref:Right handed beta helix domain-containing protein n=1 Tax=Amphimedon queenslandica TaxID=400682 RepID=A0A1X7V2G7_AMPQE
MSLLLVVVLLFFSSSCSASSGQYYVSDDCSSVTQSPCNPLSVYAADMSRSNNTIFYFIGTTTINDDVIMTAVTNVTLLGLDQFPSVYCNKSSNSISVHKSTHVTISNLSFSYCAMRIGSSNNITITNSTLDLDLDISEHLNIYNAFDVKVSSSIFTNAYVVITYSDFEVCTNELHNYSLTMTDVTLKDSRLDLYVKQHTSYNVSVIFDHVEYSFGNSFNYARGNILTLFFEGLFHFFITNSSFCGIHGHSFNIQFAETGLSSTHHGTPNSTIVIEDSQFYNMEQGLKINGNRHIHLSETVKYHVIIKSCLIYDNIKEGLFIDGEFLRSTQIDIIDTKLIGNGGNKIIRVANCILDSISLSDVTVANSTSTGLTLLNSFVRVMNNLIFKNNTGIVGGGLAINDSSRLIVSSSANLEFIDNHASYKGGGIYAKAYYSIILNAPNIPLTLINSSAGLVGGDLYGYYRSNVHYYKFNLTKPHISSTSDAENICFCDPHTNKCLANYGYRPIIYPGQALKFNVVLLGFNYSKSQTPTDGTVKILNNTSSLLYQTYIPNTCSLIQYTPKLNQTGYESYLKLAYSTSLSMTTSINFNFAVNECPIGFRIDKSQGFCTCSQSVSRENVTCDITSLNIAHNGLLWIGTYHTSTPFNANATNPNACIINEDCLLYCSPNPVTFKLNDTDTQCVDNRGHRMCGSCTEGYSLLMGSNKCGHCHDNYTMIAWIALFAVMGVLLVVLLIALNLTVSVGTLNGLLFYANIIKLYEPVFSRKGALPVLSQVISWINLDFGFEICFYNGMDSYAKQWLQFAFPLYLWIIIIIIIQLSKRYGKISRLMGSHAVPVLSTLFLLSYTKLVRTIVIVLHKREVTVHCTNESVRSVSLWYEDPNIEYTKGKHAGLFGFALLVSVVFVIPYTLFLLLNHFYERYYSNFKVFRKFYSRFKPIIDAYSGPMKDEYRFWPGLLLVARIPVLLSVTLVDSFIQSKHFLLFILLTVLVIVLSLSHCFGGVYKKRMNNVLEAWFLFMLCTMVGLSVALNEDGELPHMKCCDASIKKLFKKQDKEDDCPLLETTESHLTVDQQIREIVPSSTDVRLSKPRESVVDLF